jgi:hypothetical protein
MTGIFGLAGACVALAGFWFFRAFGAARWRDRKQLLQFSGLGLLMSAFAAGLLWLGSQYPTANFWNNVGFGADWQCEILGRGGAQVCSPNRPELTTKPAAPQPGSQTGGPSKSQ